MVPGTGRTFVFRNYSKLVNLVHSTNINKIIRVKIEYILAVPKTCIFNIIEIEELFFKRKSGKLCKPRTSPCFISFFNVEETIDLQVYLVFLFKIKV